MTGWRYRLGARWYDVLSLERLLYRRARLRLIELAAPQPGDRVLDLGCGTGLSLGPVLAAVGPNGRVVGVDASAAMLRGARRRAGGDDRVELVHAGAEDLGEVVAGPFDVALCCYSLSIVPQWRAVWRSVVDLVRPGGRVAVVDTALPTGRGRVLAPAAWLFLRAGGVHADRAVWRAPDELAHPRHERFLAEHVRLGVGTVVE